METDESKEIVEKQWYRQETGRIRKRSFNAAVDPLFTNIKQPHEFSYATPGRQKMRKGSITGKSKFPSGAMPMSDANATCSVDWNKEVPSMEERFAPSFKVPTSKRCVSSESAISEGKELGIFPVTPKK